MGKYDPNSIRPTISVDDARDILAALDGIFDTDALRAWFTGEQKSALTTLYEKIERGLNYYDVRQRLERVRDL